MSRSRGPKKATKHSERTPPNTAEHKHTFIKQMIY